MGRVIKKLLRVFGICECSIVVEVCPDKVSEGGMRLVKRRDTCSLLLFAWCFHGHVLERVLWAIGLRVLGGKGGVGRFGGGGGVSRGGRALGPRVRVARRGGC